MGALRVDVYYAGSSTKVTTGPYAEGYVFAASYSRELDRIGTFSVAVAATDHRAGAFAAGREVQIFREGEGLVCRGIIDKVQTTVDDSGQAAVVASGSNITRQLVWANTLLWKKFENQTLSAVVSNLLSGTGWSSGSLGSPSYNMAAKQFDGVSVWQALDVTAQTFRYHLRENPLVKTIDISAIGDNSGILLTQGGTVDESDNPTVGLITGIGISEESGDIWNSIIPLGGGSGVDQVTLKYATRSSPYTVQSASSGGQTYYYIEDATSVSAYGRRQRVTIVKDAVPLANSLAGWQAIANGLYDIAATYLQRRKDPVTEYTVSVVGLQHINPSGGAERFRVGQKVQLVYNGVVTDESGSLRNWLNINQQLWLMGYSRTFGPDGSDTWSLKVASVDRAPEDEEARTSDLYQQFYAIAVGLKPYTYREIHGPKVLSVDTSYPVDLPVVYDGNVALIQKAHLTVGVTKMRSNVVTAAGGGGQTSSAGGSHSHDVTQASSTVYKGTPGYVNQHQTHTTSTMTPGTVYTSYDGTGATGGTNESTSHGHTENQEASYTQSTVTAGNSVPHTHNGPSHRHTIGDHGHGTAGTGSLTLTDTNHYHDVSGQTAVAVTTHTHSVVDHNHSITYGIQEGGAPSTPQLTVTINGVDRTSALGGPWNVGFTVDITQYLVDGNGQPLRQSNTIRIGSQELTNVEVTVRSLVTATSIIPV